MIWELYLIDKHGDQRLINYYAMAPERGKKCLKRGLTKDQRLEILNQLLKEDGIDMTVYKARYCYAGATRREELI